MFKNNVRYFFLKMASKLEKILITAGVAGLLIGGEIKLADNIYKTEQLLQQKLPLAKKTYDLWNELANFNEEPQEDLAQYRKIMEKPEVIAQRKEYTQKLRKAYLLNILPQGLVLAIAGALAINYLSSKKPEN